MKIEFIVCIYTMNFIPAVFTPMAVDLSVDYDKIPKYAKYLKSFGVKRVLVNGSTGESYQLTFEERKKIVECWLLTDMEVLVHVSFSSNVETMRTIMALNQQSSKKNLVGLVVSPPIYFKPGLKELTYFMTMILKSTTISVYYYHIPSMCGDVDLDKLINNIVSNIAFRGVKYTSIDLGKFTYLKDKYPYLEFYYGRDEQFSGAVDINTAGFIGSTYNYLLPLIDAMPTQKFQLLILKVVEIFKTFPEMNVNKIIMNNIGFDCGLSRVGMPYDQLTYELISKELKKIGFEEKPSN